MKYKDMKALCLDIIKRTYPVLLIFAFIAAVSFTGHAAQDDSIKKEEQLKKQIIENLNEVMGKTRKASRLYRESLEQTKSKKKTAQKKLQQLRSRIQKAGNNKAINRKKLQSAVKLQKNARKEYKSNNYGKVLEIVDKALSEIVKVPVVSLAIEPKIVSPNSDGYNDRLIIKPQITSQQPVKKWIIRVYKKSADGSTNTTVIKTWSGTDDPPEKKKWDFKVDGKIVLSSAEDYYVTMTVVDNKKGVGKSQKESFKSDIFTERADRGLVINVSSITFPYGKAYLKNEYKSIVKKVYEFLLEFPEYNIVVEGHTDATGYASKNKKLSQRRAQSVAQYLIKLGINKSRIRTFGMGEILPVTKNAEKININRRVSFILLKNKDDLKKYKNFYNKKDFSKEIIMKNPKALKNVIP